MEITVVICTHNRCHRLRTVLECMEEQVRPHDLRWEVLVVDNNSTDETRAVVQGFRDKNPAIFRYLFEGRQGKSFALNSGVREASGKVLAFTDDDVIVDPHWLEGIVSAFAHFDCMGVAGRVLPLWTAGKPPWLELYGPYKLNAPVVCFDLGDEPCRISSPPFGANMAFRGQAFDKYGLFRTDMGPTGSIVIRGEDTEFGRRLLNAGERLMYAPSALIHHPVEKRRTEKSYFQLWYFEYGRGLVKAGGIPKDTKWYFGVPRYLLRSFVETCLTWMFTFHPQRRFYHKVNTYRVAGEIAEARRESAAPL